MTTTVDPVPERRPASEESENWGLALILTLMAVLTVLVLLLS